MNDDTVTVLGGTGTVGSRVARRLRAHGGTPRVATRHGGHVPFDWSLESTWEPALAGTSALFLMAPDGIAVSPGLVPLAVDLGVRRIVLLSSMGIEAMDDQRLLAAERHVRAGDAEWTVVRGNWFDQNFDEGFLRPAVLAGRVLLPVGETTQAFVDADDIAAVAVAALTGFGHAGAIYEVTGPEEITFGHAVDTVARAAGRPVVFDGTPEAYLAERAAAGADRADAEAEVEAFAAITRHPGEAGRRDDVERVLGRAPLPFAEYAAAAAARGVWA